MPRCLVPALLLPRVRSGWSQGGPGVDGGAHARAAAGGEGGRGEHPQTLKGRQTAVRDTSQHIGDFIAGASGRESKAGEEKEPGSLSVWD